MTQTLAIFHDAYRELNSKKLFWIVLLLSGVVVASFAAIGVYEKGLTILWWKFESIFNSRTFPPGVFYKFLFAGLGIKIWLGWIASILALVSTAGIIPDFISSGSIELVLSRPIGRFRLFLTKYAAGLLFVALQVAIFSTACFLVIGIRGKVWEPGIFWAVPLTVIFFSYLFAICVLLGMVTRSTIAALLLTLLMWFAIFGLHTTENVFLTFKIRNEVKIETLERIIAELRPAAGTGSPPEGSAVPAPSTPDAASAPAPARPDSRQVRDLERRETQLAETRHNSGWLVRTHAIVFAVKTFLPKTDETKELLSRTLISAADLERMQDDNKDMPMNFPGEDVPIDGKEVQRRLQDRLRSRPVSWVIGTSLAFEALAVGLAALMFRRRDF